MAREVTEMANSRHGWALFDKEAKVDDIKHNMIKVRICYLKLLHI